MGVRLNGGSVSDGGRLVDGLDVGEAVGALHLVQKAGAVNLLDMDVSYGSHSPSNAIHQQHAHVMAQDRIQHINTHGQKTQTKQTRVSSCVCV